MNYLNQLYPFNSSTPPITTYKLSGVVDDGESPVSGATVTLTKGVTPIGTKTTGEDGAYLFDELVGGADYTVTASKEGYISDEQDIAIESDTTKNLTLTEE